MILFDRLDIGSFYVVSCLDFSGSRHLRIYIHLGTCTRPEMLPPLEEQAEEYM
jgi:hypothetical protein